MNSILKDLVFFSTLYLIQTFFIHLKISTHNGKIRLPYPKKLPHSLVLVQMEAHATLLTNP